MTNNPKFKFSGASLIGLLVGMGLLAISITGAVKLLGLSMSAQNSLSTEKLIDQVNRISEIMTVHLNRGGSFQNPDVEARGIQLCSMTNAAMQCNGYQPTTNNFCLSIPSRVSRGGRDVINLTGFRLFNGVLAQRELSDTNMGTFNHGAFCTANPEWLNLNNEQDFQFTQIKFCKFDATTPERITQNYESNCDSVIENLPQSNMFWMALFKAQMDNKLTAGLYEEARIVHLLNTTRVRVGS